MRIDELRELPTSCERYKNLGVEAARQGSESIPFKHRERVDTFDQTKARIVQD